ncbi:lipoyl(octanoyl) transferase LipB [Neoehrlichia mikurensis]|uniref:Octanoyltransferase n=1 Tax=Neoehrlichia mikurensis TaxID=89586 RepID=A0A9Q9BUU3_9RICK|nr:lipoyl(octanoyl) transferase LipB [Neoehrlichia mikurensis]UTO55987.1 lipoyl(octanoyl) transferase LipB [Neoehrlichia mikurensis]UTO56902.1 lipoyl(octanoyl) transferase LipB [Neoehrlichia mikurensis]
MLSGSIQYEEALDFMMNRVDSIIKGNDPELIWLLEHPESYTAGTSAKKDELLLEGLFPVIYTTRGGKYSYHGPGQRIIYVMLDLKRRNQCDIKLYVKNLGTWIVNTLANFSIKSYFNNERIGVWVCSDDDKEDKIAAFGIRVRKWVTYHGISVNIYTDLSHYCGIIPCGITNYGITSVQNLGIELSYEEFDVILKKEFYKIFC